MTINSSELLLINILTVSTSAGGTSVKYGCRLPRVTGVANVCLRCLTDHANELDYEIDDEPTLEDERRHYFARVIPVKKATEPAENRVVYFDDTNPCLYQLLSCLIYCCDLDSRKQRA